MATGLYATFNFFFYFLPIKLMLNLTMLFCSVLIQSTPIKSFKELEQKINNRSNPRKDTHIRFPDNIIYESIYTIHCENSDASESEKTNDRRKWHNCSTRCYNSQTLCEALKGGEKIKNIPELKESIREKIWENFKTHKEKIIGKYNQRVMKYINTLFSFDRNISSIRTYFDKISDLKTNGVAKHFSNEIRMFFRLLRQFYNDSNRFTYAIFIFDKELSTLENGGNIENCEVKNYMEFFKYLIQFSYKCLEQILNNKENEDFSIYNKIMETSYSLNADFNALKVDERIYIEFYLTRIDKLFDLCISMMSIIENNYCSISKGDVEVEEFSVHELKILPIDYTEILMYRDDNVDLKIEKWFKHSLNVFSLPSSQNEDELKEKFDDFFDYIFHDNDDYINIGYRGLIVRIFDKMIRTYAS